MLCSLHIGTVYLQFLNQMQSLLVFRLATLTMSHLYITLVAACFLCFFVRVFCDGKKCVLYDKKCSWAIALAWKLILIMWRDIRQRPYSFIFAFLHCILFACGCLLHLSRHLCNRFFPRSCLFTGQVYQKSARLVVIKYFDKNSRNV